MRGNPFECMDGERREDRETYLFLAGGGGGGLRFGQKCTWQFVSFYWGAWENSVKVHMKTAGSFTSDLHRDSTL